jgi:Protein of unknown function (DUF4231)
MAKKTSYQDFLRQEMIDLVEQLELADLCKQSMKSRWLDQVIWADKKAEQCRQWHYRLRLTAIVGGVVLPALVGINFQLGKDNPFFRTWFPYVPFALSQIIAISAATEEFLRFGDRWRGYRQLAEDLKAEGWEYLQLSGPYQYKNSANDIPPPLPRHKISEMGVEEWKSLSSNGRSNDLTTHQDVYTLFAGRIESLINNDVQGYISALQQQKAKENEQIKQILKTADRVSTDKTLFAQPTPPPPQLPPRGSSNLPYNGYGTMGTMGTQPVPFNSPPPGGQPAPAPPMNPLMTQPTIAQTPPGFAPTPPQPTTAQPFNSPMPQQSTVADLNARILASTLKLRDMSTAEGPDGGNNACAWTVNRVLADAGIAPIGDNPNYVPSVIEALKQGRGQLVSREAAKAGDLVIAAEEAHIGIGLTDGCSRVLSNSSSRACFAWESDTDFDGSYGGQSTIYRLI